jgi:hypothetical protein
MPAQRSSLPSQPAYDDDDDQRYRQRNQTDGNGQIIPVARVHSSCLLRRGEDRLRERTAFDPVLG